MLETYNKNNTHQNSLEATKAVLRGTSIDLYAYIRKDKMLIINNLSFYLTQSAKKISKLKSKTESEENKEHEVKK